MCKIYDLLREVNSQGYDLIVKTEARTMRYELNKTDIRLGHARGPACNMIYSRNSISDVLLKEYSDVDVNGSIFIINNTSDNKEKLIEEKIMELAHRGATLYLLNSGSVSNKIEECDITLIQKYTPVIYE